MLENQTRLKDISNKKDKIRARYQGINVDEIEVIPAIPQKNFFEDYSEKRVAVYVRVSTDDPRQTSSYELQKNYYVDMIGRHENWHLIKIYADEGISGTSLKHRDAFVEMIADCKAGKIDLIVTKSVSRFARNVVDCIGSVRQLAAMPSPVGVFFEMENIYTLNSSSEMSLSFIATLAQEESHIKSNIMKDSIEKRFRFGIFLTPPLLGYDQDEEGNLVINEEEAKTVRLIFFMYLYGYTCQQISEMLSTLGRTTKRNNTVWSSSTILQILQNERHSGDIRARKTWTPSYLDHLSRKNRDSHNQYTRKDNHEAIISRDDYIAVQRLISNVKYGNKGILPELRVITEGALKGFVSINPRWANFKDEDYQEASSSVDDEIIQMQSKTIEIVAQFGDFDLRGFEIARSQFFITARKVCVTLSINGVWFSTECIRKFNKVLYIEMLIHPRERLFVVRQSAKESRNAVKWANINQNNYCSRRISGAAYMGTIYKLLGWDPACKYRVRGIRRQKGNEAIVIFDMREGEVLGPKNNIAAFPQAWTTNFGNNYYRHTQARELMVVDQNGMWDVTIEGQPYNNPRGLNITNPEEIARGIKQIIQDMKEEGEGNDGRT